MSGEDLDNLFRIDSKIISRGTEMEQGSGLGLILTKEFADILSWKIKAESKKGSGTSFFIFFNKYK